MWLPNARSKYPQGKIPVLIDNKQSPPFAIIESPAQFLYLLELADKDHILGFSDKREWSECLQWLFFWHGSGAPSQVQLDLVKFYGEDNPRIYINLI
jgi:glutathione S-transferase